MIWLANLASGEQGFRTDIVGPGSNPFRLPDGRVYMVPNGNDFDSHVIYSPESNTFTPADRLPWVQWSRFSASPSGRFMLDNLVFNASFDRVAVVESPDWKLGSWPPPGASTLSADGQAAYLATAYGYDKVRVSDGALLEQVKLPAKAQVLIATSDGTRLLAVGESSTMVVDIR